jgi:hypothetical protein
MRLAPSRESCPDLLPAFRGVFTPQEIRTHLAQIEREENAHDADNARQFAGIKELLATAELGTS